MDGPIFDATKYDPTQGMAKHPVGKFPAVVAGTDIKPTKEGDGHFFEVVFKTQAGEIAQRYNLWNSSQQAADIAHRQLSALCHATGVYRLDMNNKGADLLNKQLTIEVGEQNNNKNYNEVKKVYDAGGNEPKAGQQPQPAQQSQQPQQQQPASQPQPQPSGGSSWQPPNSGSAAPAGGSGGTSDNRPPWAK